MVVPHTLVEVRTDHGPHRMHILRSSLAAAATALVALGLVVTPASVTPSQAATQPTTTTRVADPAAGDDGKASIEVVPADRGVMRPDEPLSLTVTVTNDTDADLPAGSAEFDIFRQYAGTRDVLADWLSDTSTTGYLGAPMDTVDVPAVPAHRSVTLSDVEIVPGNVALGGYSSFGARRIAADYTAGSTSAVDRTAITWYPNYEQTPVGVSVAMPVTMPANAGGLIPAGDLAAATSVDGTLSQQLDAAQDHNVALGIDPRIIASIRILGENAPSSAIAWLDRLERMRNETFALSYADADVTGLRQAGSDEILAPISLDQSVDPEDFPGASTPSPTGTPSGTATATPGASDAPAPTPTAAPSDDATADPGTAATPTLPTTASLLDFPYTMSSIAWPTEGTVATDDLPALRKAGTKSTVVASSNTSAGGDTTIAASEKIGDDHVLVSDQGMSALLRDAATATTQRAWSGAMSELTATLATASRQGSTSGPVLLTLGRSWPTDSTRLSEALDALESTAWVSPADLSTAAATTPGSLTLASASDDDARLAQLRRIVRSAHDLTDFASAVADPAQLTAPARLADLAAASNAWRSDQDGLVAAVDARVAKTDKVVASVGILNGSSILLLGDRSSLPISIRNRSDFPITVFLTVQPSNSFLRIEKNAVKVTVQPDSSNRVTFPVTSVANGKVELTMALTTAAGVRIADPEVVEINVQAQWESLITAAAAIAVILIFGLGIFRNVRRRLRRRRNGEADEPREDPNRLFVADAPGADDRTGGSEQLPGTATALATAGSTATLSEDGGDRLDAAIQRAGAVSSLQADDTRTDHPQEPTISTPQPQPSAAAPVAQRSLGRASAMLAAGTMISRVLGFAKTFVLAYAIGQTHSPAADAFAVSNQIPNNIYALIAGGLLSAVLIPQIVRSMKQNADGGVSYVNKIVTLGATAFLVITVVATVIAPVLVRLYASQATDGKGFSPEQTDLAVALAFWCLPQILFYALYSLLGEVLNAKQVFGPFTWAPLINNVIAIAGLIVFIALFGGRVENSGVDTWTPMKIAVLAGSASLGVLAQAAFLPLFWRRAGLTFRPDFRWRGVGLKATGTAAGWLFAMILVTQLAGIVQSRVASLGTGSAGNAVLQNAWLLFMLPHSIITVSIATAYFTRMTHDAERGDLDSVRRNLSLSLRIVGLFTVFSSVALTVVAVPFGRMFARDFEGALSIGAVLLAYMPGLVLFSMLFIIQRVFWAMHDHRTPFLMQLVQSGLFVIGALAVTTLPGSAIGVGVAACTTLAGTAQTIVALVLVRRRLGGMEGAVVTRSHVQFVIAALLAGVAGLLVANFFGTFSADGFAMADFTSAAITVVLSGAVMVVVYFLALVVAKNGEITNAVSLVRSRLGR
jgi:murein biosynthesis integral membrane protein MurJ